MPANYCKTLVLSYALLALFSTVASSQILKGVVQDQVTGNPLPYASIQAGKSGFGTVTNENGEFKLDFSRRSIDTLIISYIGYISQTRHLTNPDFSETLIISLTASEKLLPEVVVISHDSLKDILQTAYQKITDNYPDYGNLIRGFYRETNEALPTRSFIYFSESLIEFYKPSYSNKEFGPVKILFGGKFDSENRKVFFHAGVYSPQRYDFVKQREEFINPNHFDRYQYTKIAETASDSGKVYVIAFKPVSNAKYEGTLYLDANTLAYMGADYELTKTGLRKMNLSLSSFSYTQRKYMVRYKRIQGRWNIYLVTQDGRGSNDGDSAQLRYTNEYVSNTFQAYDHSPIKEADAIPFSGVYTSYTEKFSDAFWDEPETIQRNKKLEETVQLLFNKETKDRIDSTRNNPTHKRDQNRLKFKNSLRKIITQKLSTNLGIGLMPLSITPGNYSVNYRNESNVSTDLRKSAVPVGVAQLKFYTSTSVAISTRMYVNLFDQQHVELVSLGIEWSKNLAGWKHPLYFQPSLNFYYGTFFSYLGETSLPQGTKINNVEFKDKPVKMGAGELRYGLTPAIQLVYKRTGGLSIFVEVQSSIFSSSKSKVFFEQKRNLFSKRRSTLDSGHQDVAILFNGNSTSDTGTHYFDFKLFPSLGLKIGLK